MRCWCGYFRGPAFMAVPAPVAQQPQQPQQPQQSTCPSTRFRSRELGSRRINGIAGSKHREVPMIQSQVRQGQLGPGHYVFICFHCYCLPRMLIHDVLAAYPSTQLCQPLVDPPAVDPPIDQIRHVWRPNLPGLSLDWALNGPPRPCAKKVQN